MEFLEIGDRLKSERTRRGLSIDQVMADTKLSRSNLNAMEAGEFESLPHPVYAKGFVRNYANYLGLDGEELASYLDDLLPKAETDLAREPELPEPYEVPEDVSSSKKSWPSILLLLLLGLAMVGLVFYLNAGGKLFGSGQGQQTEIVQDSQAPAAEAEAQSSVADGQKAADAVKETDALAEEAQDVAGVDSDEVHDSSSAADDGAPAEGASADGGDSDATAPAGEPAAAEAASSADAAQDQQAGDMAGEMERQDDLAVAPEGESPASVPATDGMRVFSLIAKPGDASWMQVRVDDGPVKEYILRDGAGMNFRFANTLYVRLGNGGGVEAYLDGKDYPIDAEHGQVRTLIIPE